MFETDQAQINNGEGIEKGNNHNIILRGKRRMG
jgi:hypothetical protein